MSKYPQRPPKNRNDYYGQGPQYLNDEEVKIIGKISRLYFQGRQLYPSAGEDTETEPVRKKNKAYIIVPVKIRDGCVEFIKIPMCKMEKGRGVKAKNMGNLKIQRLSPDGCEITERVPLCVAQKSAIPLFDNKRFPKGGTNSVEFVYKRESAPPPKQESGCSKKFRCRRKTKGTPPKDKKKDKPKRKKSRTSEKETNPC